MSARTDILRHRVEQVKGQRMELEQTVAEKTRSIRELGRELRKHEEAREIIRQVALQTQQQLQYHIGDVASMALEAIDEEPYKLVLEFVERRNKTECDIFFERNGNRMNPLNASGFGAVDVAAFALRIASWSMRLPHSRNTIILDEPFRFLSEEFHEAASLMVKEISQKLGIQFLIVTHQPAFASHADRIFHITALRRKGDKISSVTQQK